MENGKRPAGCVPEEGAAGLTAGSGRSGRNNPAVTAGLSVVLALFILSCSIAVPILIRPFYYAQIGPLRLTEQTGLSTEQIRTAYDEMMDFCLGKTDEFSTGVLAWSESGRDHFADCRTLFLLDLYVLAGSAALLALAGILRLWQRHRRFLLWGPAGLGAAFLLIGGAAALDFDRAFVVFHHLFFPGKENWIFDPDVDQIIRILPEVFFRNAALCILAVLLLLCGGCLALYRRNGKQA